MLSGDRLAHDPSVLTDLAHALEAVLLEELDGRAEQKPALRLTALGDLRDRLHETAATFGDLTQGAFERGARDALAAVSAVNEDTGDAPIRNGRRDFVVLAPMVDSG